MKPLFKKHGKKRAFTTMEMIVCCIAMGLLVSAIGVFTTSVANYIISLKSTESAMLAEYADVKHISQNSSSLSAINNIYATDALENEHYFVRANTITPGQTTNVPTSLTANATYFLEWEVDNTSVATVSSSGVVTAVSPGTTFVTVRQYKLEENGSYSLTDNEESFPIYVVEADVYGDTTNLVCFAYIGKYYSFWRYIDVGV